MKKNILLGVSFVLLLLITGCKNEGTANDKQINVLRTQLDELKEKVQQYESDFRKLDQSLDETQGNHEKEISRIKHDVTLIKSHSISRLRSSTMMNQQLITHTPAITHKQAFINEITDNYIIVDFAQWVHDPNAPNNGRLQNEEKNESKLFLNEHAQLYVLRNGTDIHQVDLTDYQLGQNMRLFNCM